MVVRWVMLGGGEVRSWGRREGENARGECKGRMQEKDEGGGFRRRM